MTIQTLESLQSAAVKEDWESVNQHIKSICNDSKSITWALEEGISNLDRNLRDLGVSILEVSDYVLKPEDIDKITELLQKDENPYVRFRAAFTLFNRGHKTNEVMDKMQEALQDPDVKEIAEQYLNKN